MIRPNVKIGIVYSQNSKKYADDLKKLITQRRQQGYCIDVVMVDEEIIDAEREIGTRVFNNLDQCSYGIVFLTKDIHINDESYQYVSKPNVLLELGYFKGRLNKNNIWCIIDFQYKEVKDKYLMPSDIPAEVLEIIDKNNSYNSISKIFDKFIATNQIIRLENYNANDLDSSLLLNPLYKTNYSTLFLERQLKAIEKFSVKWQAEEILSIWMKEKEMLSDVEQIIYLFERMVMLSFFSEELINERLDNFLYVELATESRYAYTCQKILEYINSYEMYKRERKPADFEFCLKIAENIQEKIEIFKGSSISPIIECVARDYIGLGYLNAFLALPKEAKEDNKYGDLKTNLLQMSKENFECVLKINEESLNDSTGIFSAFVYYNLARVNRNLGQPASYYFNQGINKRNALSRSKYFPEIFRLNFALERIHAEIDYYDYLKESDNQVNYVDKIKRLKEEMEKMKKTPVVEVSLFKRIEDRLNQRMEISNRY